MNRVAYGLLESVTALAVIINQPVDENGVIQVRYQDAAEAINLAQMMALRAVEELTAD